MGRSRAPTADAGRGSRGCSRSPDEPRGTKGCRRGTGFPVQSGGVPGDVRARGRRPAPGECPNAARRGGSAVMARETAAVKARRLLVEGRVQVERVDGRRVVALVRGDSAALYVVVFDGRWSCT